MNNLAVIIPAYKGKFLPRTLQALVNQTDKRFTVYIGDDNSPDDIGSIVKNFEADLLLKYKRFSENLGKNTLVRHWKRCIQMVGNEEWYWLLPDDDVPSENAIERFYKVLTGDRAFSLLRFRTEIIDENGSVIDSTSKQMIPSGNMDMIKKKLCYEFNSSLAEYIFSAEAYKKVGGFVEYPLGWHSDDMLWYSILSDNNLKYDDHAVVQLRQSKLNISNSKEEIVSWKKLDAHYRFFNDLISTREFGELISQGRHFEIIDIFSNYLFYEMLGHGLRFSGYKLLLYSLKNNQLLGGGIPKNIYRLIRHNRRLK